jgi:DNA-binding MarR family transcriptional regulator
MTILNNPYDLISHLAFVLDRQADIALQEELGFGITQYKIMATLKGTVGMLQKKIAFNLGQTEAGISRQMKVLEQKTLLQIEVNPIDRRQHLISLTYNGERIMEQADNLLKQNYAPLFDRLSEGEKNNLMSVLSLLHESVCTAKH